jgi:hypothetical protein
MMELVYQGRSEAGWRPHPVRPRNPRAKYGEYDRGHPKQMDRESSAEGEQQDEQQRKYEQQAG